MAHNAHTQEPTALEFALHERWYVTGFGAIGPLTQLQAQLEEEYERHMQEMQDEEEARVAAGGREVCSECGQRSVRSQSVCTLGIPGRMGSEYSTYRTCENCNYQEL